MQFVVDHAVTWMPHFPEHHLPATLRTTERITPRTGQHASAVGLLRHDTIRPLDQPTQRHHQRGEYPLHLLGLARGMETIITNGVSLLQTNKYNSTCWPHCPGHTLPPSGSKTCHPARNGGLHDHPRFYYRLILRGR